jgi:SAM-dependent methyltransferase
MQDYDSKDESYFSAARRDIEPILPGAADRVLELGCGAGATLAWLQRSGRARHTVGIEIFENAAQQARAVVDQVYCQDFEHAPAPKDLGTFDLILCLDVLEHFVDPWRAVDRLVRDHLALGGTILLSVPNVRHYSVLLPLVFRGRWEYSDHGPLDRTHLRFFTYASAMQLLRHPLLSAPRCLRPGFAPGSRKALFDNLTLGCLREFLAFHYLVSAVKSRES